MQVNDEDIGADMEQADPIEGTTLEGNPIVSVLLGIINDLCWIVKV